MQLHSLVRTSPSLDSPNLQTLHVPSFFLFDFSYLAHITRPLKSETWSSLCQTTTNCKQLYFASVHFDFSNFSKLHFDFFIFLLRFSRNKKHGAAASGFFLFHVWLILNLNKFFVFSIVATVTTQYSLQQNNLFTMIFFLT